MNFKKLLVGLGLGLGLGVMGCGEGQVVSADDVAVGDDDLSSRAESYLTLRRDMRRCASPMCGGWFGKDVNKTTAEQYFFTLDLSAVGLSADEQDAVQAAAAGEVVLRGKLTRYDSHHSRSLIVSEAYIGLPGNVATGTFYNNVLQPIRCIRAPCPNLRSGKLNATTTTLVDGLNMDAALQSFVDPTWIQQEVQEGRVLAAGAFAADAVGGTELVATQVFVQLPYGHSMCPHIQLSCPGQKVAQVRDASRCVLPSACVASHVCTQMIPNCPAGYTMHTWAGETGCPSFACDPTWMH
jgi:hypothetical protein